MSIGNSRERERERKSDGGSGWGRKKSNLRRGLDDEFYLTLFSVWIRSRSTSSGMKALMKIKEKRLRGRGRAVT